MIRLLTIIGARPQIIKAAALSRAINNNFGNEIEEVIVHTGQHYDDNLSRIFFEELGIPEPMANLSVGSASHGKQTAAMVEGIEEMILKFNPDYLILYGDTNSTLAGAISASKMHLPIVHIEAGLRSFNRKMPEEVNRVVCDHLSTLLFSPTSTGFNNLVKEGFVPSAATNYSPDRPGIFHCGDIMYDNSLFFSKMAADQSSVLKENDLVENEYILATIHRDHNTDVPQNLNDIFKALMELTKEYKVFVPLHPRTKHKLRLDENKEIRKEIESNEALIIAPPVSFLDMIQLESSAKMIVTDSGGVQKEAYFFKKPCIILRSETEWVEIVNAGKAVLCGSDHKKIIDAFKHFKISYDDIFPEIFGDGHAAEFICEKILENHSSNGE